MQNLFHAYVYCNGRKGKQQRVGQDPREIWAQIIILIEGYTQDLSLASKAGTAVAATCSRLLHDYEEEDDDASIYRIAPDFILNDISF